MEARESCSVCHADGSSYDATAAHALDREVKYSVIAPPAADGADLVVRFNIKVNGVNYDFFTVPNRAVIFNGVGGIYTQTSVVNAPTTVQSLGSGNYLIRVAGKATSIGTDSRYYFRLGSTTGVTPARRASVYADDAGYKRVDLVSNQSCQNCHSTFAGELTSHHYNPFEAKSCIACHSASNPPNGFGLAYLAHGIHNSHEMPSGEFVIGTPPNTEEFSVTYPTYMTNCSVCHDSTATLAAANAMPVTGPGCFTCHESMESWDFTESGTTFHEAYTEATNCQTCHKAGRHRAGHGDGVPQQPRDRARRHHLGRRGPVRHRRQEVHLEDRQRRRRRHEPEDLLVGDLQRRGGGSVQQRHRRGKPIFHNAPAGTVLDGAPQFLRTYAQGDDFILGKSTTAPGQPGTLTLNTTNTTCAGNVATTTWAVDKDVAAGARAYVALQGKPQLPLPAGFDKTVSDYEFTNMYVRVPTPDREFVVGTGAKPATERRAIADTGDCLKCHVGSLYQHGNTRVDNVKMCGACHNSASSEQNIRVGMGVTKSEAYDGLVGQTYEFKTLLHAVHSAGEEDSRPIVIYRTRGIYAWAPDKALLPNWATGEACDAGSVPGVDTLGNIVFGSDPASTNKCQQHNLYTPTYPREANDCAACHVATFDVIPDQSKAVATTLDAGSTTWQNQIDDTLQGASAAACTTCHWHQSTDAKGHAYTNGWVPQDLRERASDHSRYEVT